MQTGGGGFAGAVGSQDQLVDYKVTIGFPGSVQSSFQDITKCVVSVDIQQSVTTNLPDGTTLISGYPSSAATIVLSGMLNQAAGIPLVEAQSAYWLFNPNDSTSPMWRTTRGGLSVTVQAGFWDGASAADLVTKFTGTIDQVTCSNGTVTLMCRDNRSTITNQATLPPVITQAPYNAGLTSGYAIDYLLRHSSPGKYLSWPAQHPNCVLSVGFESSIWAEVGTLKSGFVQDPLFSPGPYGTGLGSNDSTLTVYTPSAPLLTTDNICCHLLSGGDFDVNINDDPATYQVTFQRGGTTLFLYTTSPSGQTVAAWSLTAGNHELEFSVSWPASSTSVTGTVWIDGVPNAVSFAAKDVRPVGQSFLIVAAVGGTPGGLRGMQLTNEASYATYYPFTPTLVLDPAGSLNPLTALPDVSGRDTWSVLQDIASAEAAVIGFDELGVMHFTNRQTIKTLASARSITSTTSLLGLDSLEQMSLCATHVQVPVNQIFIGQVQNVWVASNVVSVPAAGSTTFIATTSSPVVGAATNDAGFWPVGSTPAGNTWRACVAADGNGDAVTFGISLSVVQLSPTSFTVTLTNSSLFPVYMVQPVVDANPVTPTGTPFIAITGQPVSSVINTVAPNGGVGVAGPVIADAQWPSVANGGAVSNTQFGEVVLALPSDDWCQDLPSAQALADYLIGDLHYPKPLFRNVAIIADARLQLLDRVTLVDPDVSQVSSDALLIGIETRLSAGQWTQTIDARAWNRPGAWVLGVPGRSELGVTTYIY